MLETAHKYFREKYPKEYRHMLRLWTLSWRTSRPLTTVAVLLLVGGGLVGGIFLGKQFSSTNIYMPPQTSPISGSMPGRPEPNPKQAASPAIEIDNSSRHFVVAGKTKWQKFDVRNDDISDRTCRALLRSITRSGDAEPLLSEQLQLYASVNGGKDGTPNGPAIVKAGDSRAFDIVNADAGTNELSISSISYLDLRKAGLPPLTASTYIFKIEVQCDGIKSIIQDIEIRYDGDDRITVIEPAKTRSPIAAVITPPTPRYFPTESDKLVSAFLKLRTIIRDDLIGKIERAVPSIQFVIPDVKLDQEYYKNTLLNSVNVLHAAQEAINQSRQQANELVQSSEYRDYKDQIQPFIAKLNPDQKLGTAISDYMSALRIFADNKWTPYREVFSAHMELYTRLKGDYSVQLNAVVQAIDQKIKEIRENTK
jgi:hypothetical protein